MVPDKLPPETDIAAPGSAKARRVEARQKSGPAKVFALRKTPCYGECPVFRISVQSDGTVLFSGVRNVAPLGDYRARVTSGWVDRLLRKAIAQGVYGLSATYPENTDLFIADASNTITTIVWNGREKTITHNHDAPPVLTALEDTLTELIGELKWEPLPQDQ
jgi:hypothetical protein